VDFRHAFSQIAYLAAATLVVTLPLAMLTLSVLLASAAVPAAAQPSSGCSKDTFDTGENLARTIDVGGVRRNYILHVPKSARPHKPVPVLLDFHGWGHSAAGVWRVSQFKPLAERDAFITVYPDGMPVALRPGESRPGWELGVVEGNRDLAFTKAILDRLESDFCIDRARVYSTGFSNGAFFSHILGCVLSDRIAAIAPVSGGHITVPCKPDRPVPVLIYHGIHDELISIDRARAARDTWVKIDDCGAAAKDSCERYACAGGTEVRYCEVAVGHTWPPQATGEIWNFLRRYSVPIPAAREATPEN
jgi:polyhydroxybutyrate depolymerase